MHDHETWHVPPGVLEGLKKPEPVDDLDRELAAIASWPIRIAGWTEVAE